MHYIIILNYLTLFSFTDKGGVEHKDVTAKFECGQKEGLCGMDSPNKIFQCSEHSSTTQSCCYLTTPTYTECILSDKKYDKETTFKLFEESTIICYSNKLKINNISYGVWGRSSSIPFGVWAIAQSVATSLLSRLSSIARRASFRLINTPQTFPAGPSWTQPSP